MDQDKYIEKFKFFKRLTSLPFMQAIWLYGSRARGDNGEHSDIDLALIMVDSDREKWRRVMEIVEVADTLLKIDCVDYRQLELDASLRHSIDRDHLILFEKEKTMQEKINQKLDYVEKALGKLDEMVHEPVDAKRAQIDSTIQRFEFCFELFWKMLKVVLESLGVKTTYPKEVLQEAFKGGLITQETLWLSMLDDRNETSHVYDENAADRVYGRIKQDYNGLLTKTFHGLKNRFYKPTS